MAKKYNGLVQNKVSSTNENWLTTRTDTDLDAVITEWNSLWDVVQPLVKARFVAVHAGAYRGVFAKRLSEIFTLVYTFEPDPLNFHCLVNNNQVDNVIKLQSALSNDHALVNVVNDDVTVDGVTYVANGDYPSLRVDDLSLQALNLLILDVGGYEFEAILGSVQTVKKFSGIIAVKDSNDDVTSFLGNHGFHVVTDVVGYTVYEKNEG